MINYKGPSALLAGLRHRDDKAARHQTLMLQLQISIRCAMATKAANAAFSCKATACVTHLWSTHISMQESWSVIIILI